MARFKKSGRSRRSSRRRKSSKYITLPRGGVRL